MIRPPICIDLLPSNSKKTIHPRNPRPGTPGISGIDTRSCDPRSRQWSDLCTAHVGSAQHTGLGDEGPLCPASVVSRYSRW